MLKISNSQQSTLVHGPFGIPRDPWRGPPRFSRAILLFLFEKEMSFHIAHKLSFSYEQKHKYSQCPKSKLVFFSDVQLLAQFQTVGFSASVRNPNIFVQILDRFLHLKSKPFCLKTEHFRSDFGLVLKSYIYAAQMGLLRPKTSEIWIKTFVF